MKAVVVHDIRQARVEEVDEPQVIPGSLKVKVEACAICGSDVRIFTKGDHRATFPRIIGHEIAGVVVEVGEGTEGFKVGQRVCVAPGHGCGECRYCKNGMGNVCINPRPSIGYAASGGFAQYIVPPVNVVREGFVNPIPDNLSFEEACMSELLACTINGQERVEVGAGDTVLVIGAGAAGAMHVELARARGAKKVMLAGRSRTRLEMVRERFSPDVVFFEQGEELVKRVLDETDGLGADVIILAAPSSSVQELALSMIAPRGRICFFAGIPRDNRFATIDSNIIHYTECVITGASSSLGRQNREALQLISEGKVRAQRFITHRFNLDEFSDAIAAIERKEVIKAVIFPWKN